MILYGNLAPKGAVVKAAGVRPEMLKHSGPAVIFEAETEAYEGIVGGRVKAGDVVVIRYEGPRGGPGMQEMLAPTTAIKGRRARRPRGTDYRRPILRRNCRRLHRAHQPRGRRGRADRPARTGRHHRHRYPRPLAERSPERRRTRPPGEAMEAAAAALHHRLPRQVRRLGHQRRHRRSAQVGLKRRKLTTKARRHEGRKARRQNTLLLSLCAFVPLW